MTAHPAPAVTGPGGASMGLEAPAAWPLVTVIVPCRNERRYIRDCVESILAGDYPADRLELLVADGMSDDGTREVLAELQSQDPRVRLLDNPRRITPCALNVALAHASGDVVVRMDAHNGYPPHYVRTLVGWLLRSGADNVGGAWRTCPAEERPEARAVAAVLSHPLGVGNARYRLGVSEPCWVDTVPFGCYRRDVFGRIGGFDEELVRNQDDELNHRLRRSGGRILLVPGAESRYYARESMSKLGRMFWQYGLYKPLVVRKVGAVCTLRQLAPPAFVLALLGGLVLAALGGLWTLPILALGAVYGAATVGSAARSVRSLGWRAAALMPAAFAVAHLSYGAGFLVGAARLVRPRASRTGAADAVPLSR
ncbi:MAG TPA: glycosyltransferase family 2 protein [Gemmatimonadaceae bacterium]|nr:glycosyltransferase family 2 protein [Gemmatimonadaceae bacterium]